MSLFEDLHSLLSEPKILGKVFDWGIVWGSALGVCFLFASMAIIRQRNAIVISLLIIGFSSLLILPANSFRIQRGPVNSDRLASVQAHDKLRHQQSWVFYTQGCLALFAACLGGDKSSAAKFLTTISFVGGLIAAALGLWLQLKELQIVFPELRALRG